MHQTLIMQTFQQRDALKSYNCNSSFTKVPFAINMKSLEARTKHIHNYQVVVTFCTKIVHFRYASHAIHQLVEAVLILDAWCFRSDDLHFDSDFLVTLNIECLINIAIGARANLLRKTILASYFDFHRVLIPLKI